MRGKSEPMRTTIYFLRQGSQAEDTLNKDIFPSHRCKAQQPGREWRLEPTAGAFPRLPVPIPCAARKITRRSPRATYGPVVSDQSALDVIQLGCSLTGGPAAARAFKSVYL